MNDGLKEKHRKAIVRILSANPRLKRAVLFGSRAMGTHTATSDVDIALFGKELTLDDQARLATEIEKQPIPQQVDLLRFHEVKNKALLKHIEKHGQEWYRREEKCAPAAARDSNRYRPESAPAATGRRRARRRNSTPPFAGTWRGLAMASDGWKTYRLGEVTENYDFKRVPVKKADRRPGPYPYYGASGVVDHVDQYIFDGEYLLIAEDGENLRSRKIPVAFIATGKFWVNNHAHIVMGNGLSNTRFLAYLLDRIDISGFLSGSTMPKLTQGNMNRIEVRLPTKPVQDAIVAFVSSLDKKLHVNLRMNWTLEKMAAAIFKSWLIDFDPVHAKAEGRDINLPADIADLFPDSFEDSELGVIPAGWTVAPIKDLADVNARGINKDYPHARIRYVDISSVSQSSLDQTTAYDLADAPNRAKRLVQTGDTIWSCVRPNRKAYLYIDRPADNLVVSTGFAVLSPRTVPSSYLHQWVTTQAFVDYLTAYATGAAYPAVKADTFETAKMILPGKGILKAFHDLVGLLRARIAHNQRQNHRLAGLRDALLPKLLSGEIELPEAETATEGVQ
jgi:type I restriction enzyme S subunit